VATATTVASNPRVYHFAGCGRLNSLAEIVSLWVSAAVAVLGK
jgi:hypothetical protein